MFFGTVGRKTHYPRCLLCHISEHCAPPKWRSNVGGKLFPATWSNFSYNTAATDHCLSRFNYSIVSHVASLNWRSSFYFSVHTMGSPTNFLLLQLLITGDTVAASTRTSTTSSQRSSDRFHSKKDGTSIYILRGIEEQIFSQLSRISTLRPHSTIAATYNATSTGQSSLI